MDTRYIQRIIKEETLRVLRENPFERPDIDMIQNKAEELINKAEGWYIRNFIGGSVDPKNPKKRIFQDKCFSGMDAEDVKRAIVHFCERNDKWDDDTVALALDMIDDQIGRSDIRPSDEDDF